MPSWLKLVQAFWRRRFFAFLLFRYYLPLDKCGPFIWTNMNLLHPRVFHANFGWNLSSDSGGEDENFKILRQQRQRRRRTKDKLWSEKLNLAFGSGELKTIKHETKRWGACRERRPCIYFRYTCHIVNFTGWVWIQNLQYDMYANFTNFTNVQYYHAF